VSAARPLQNRVDPFGELIATSARGALMGNRGGKLHRPDQTLGGRRWASRQWIACVCSFKARKREVWGRGYSELFFLDEPTALAAGHRPCFECRHQEAENFRAAFDRRERVSASAMDAILHGERLAGRAKRSSEQRIEDLPDGAMIAVEGRAFLVRGDALWPWSFQGYGAPLKRPASGVVAALTPPSILRALHSGYEPRWAELGAAAMAKPP
jgi:hypothetical protein